MSRRPRRFLRGGWVGYGREKRLSESLRFRLFCSSRRDAKLTTLLSLSLSLFRHWCPEGFSAGPVSETDFVCISFVPLPLLVASFVSNSKLTSLSFFFPLTARPTSATTTLTADFSTSLTTPVLTPPTTDSRNTRTDAQRSQRSRRRVRTF